MKKIKLTIEGMHCASCASNAERALKKVKGVREVSVSVMTKKGFVEAEDDVSKEDMKRAVAKAGYKVVNVEEN
ncbi:MAG: heavy metal-associated domain-containing protein [Candidatus Pacearchaeota archaeon]